MRPERRFYFLRHGETDWNLQGRIQGQTDTPLNATGLGQARALSARLAGCPINRVVTSPLRRARDTAEAAAAALGVPIHDDDALKERGFGSFEGRIINQLRIEYGIAPGRSLRRIMPADAEPWESLVTRTMSAVARWLTAYPSETLLFVSHSGPFSVVHEQLIGARLGVSNAMPFLFAPGASGWTIEAVGASGPAVLAGEFGESTRPASAG